MQAGRSQVVHVKEFAHGRSRSPTRHFCGAGHFGFVEASKEGRKHVAVFRVVVVARPVQVGGHGADEVASVLVAVGVAELQPSDFGDGVRFVGGLQCAGEEHVFGHGLRRVFGVDAGTAQKEKLVHARPAAAFNHVRLHEEVVVEEIRFGRVVGVDAAHFGGGQVDVRGLDLFQKRKHRRLIAQVQLSGSAQDQVGVPARLKRSNQSGAHHATVASHINGSVEVEVRHGVKVQP